MSEIADFFNERYHKGYEEAIKKLKKIKEICKKSIETYYDDKYYDDDADIFMGEANIAEIILKTIGEVEE